MKLGPIRVAEIIVCIGNDALNRLEVLKSAFRSYAEGAFARN